MVRTTVSPTGIETEAWIWIRSCQLVLATATWITGCAEARRFLFVFLALFPIFLLSVWNTVDAAVFYRQRYTRGAGAISILRTLNDWFILCVLGVTCPFIFIGWNWYGPFDSGEVFIWTMFGFVVTNMCFYFASAIMLCVEDARMRKNGRMLVPAATIAMPTPGEVMYRGADLETYSKRSTVDSQTALKLVNNMLRNGFTVNQLALMGSQQVEPMTPTESTPPQSPSPAIPTTPPMRTRSDIKRSSYEPGPPHYDT